MKYEVRVRHANSLLSEARGTEERVEVEADSAGDALVKAAMQLDEQNKRYWSLVKISAVTS
jgi:hypothetical protein